MVLTRRLADVCSWPKADMKSEQGQHQRRDPRKPERMVNTGGISTRDLILPDLKPDAPKRTWHLLPA
jgi:hypothetical protein